MDLGFLRKRMAGRNNNHQVLFGNRDKLDQRFVIKFGTEADIIFLLTANEGKQINFNLFCDKVLTGDILTGLKEKKYDIGFCSKFDDEPLIEFIPVAKQDLVVIVPPGHPLAEKSEIHLEETLPRCV